MSLRNIVLIIIASIVFTIVSYFWVTWCIEPLGGKIISWWHTAHKKSNAKLVHSLNHLAIIMDGNRRWAKKQGLATWLGHKKGVDPVKTTVEFCINNNISHLSLYALSLENLKRSEEELKHIFDLIEQGLTNEEFEKLLEHGVKIRIIGDHAYFPEHLIPVFNNLEETTKDGKRLTLNILFCYGGQQEIAATMQAIGRSIEQGQINSQDITTDLIQRNLWINDSPAPDLIIRTGGCNRLSNFLTWQSAYSELMFIPTYWPDITQQDLELALEQFITVQRNFGK